MSGFREVESNSWADFVAHVTKHIEAAERHGDPLYFRGQANASWGLETTLERSGYIAARASEYVAMVMKYLPEIESVTGRKWGVPTWQEWLAGDNARARNSDPGSWPWFEFFVYLRQFGFPSPLMDWTRSPWIASHFALGGDLRSVERLAIFAYQRPRSLMDSEPDVVRLHNGIRSGDRRHFVQQACYTTATHFDMCEQEMRFVSHEVSLKENWVRNGYLTKFVLDVAWLPQARRWLEKCGIDDHRLFGTEDAFINTIGRRVLDIDSELTRKPYFLRRLKSGE